VLGKWPAAQIQALMVVNAPVEEIRQVC